MKKLVGTRNNYSSIYLNNGSILFKFNILLKYVWKEVKCKTHLGKDTFVPLEFLASTSPCIHLLNSKDLCPSFFRHKQVCTVFLEIVIFLNFLHVLGRIQNEEQNGHFYVDGKSYRCYTLLVGFGRACAHLRCAHPSFWAHCQTGRCVPPPAYRSFAAFPEVRTRPPGE